MAQPSEQREVALDALNQLLADDPPPPAPSL